MNPRALSGAILLGMRTVAILLSAGILLPACTKGQYWPQPTAPSVVVGPPATLTLNITAGVGVDANKAAVSAHVYDATGHAVGSTSVTFDTSSGTMDPATTLADAGGLAQARLIATGGATVTITATAGSASASQVVTLGTVPTVPTPPPYVPPPPPLPEPPAVNLNLNIPAGGTTGLPVTMGLSASTRPTWTWSFGDGQTIQTTAFTTSHVYTAAGRYTVTVSGDGASASGLIVIADPPAPPPTPTLALTATVVCTAGGAGLASICNLSGLTYGGAQLGMANVATIAWDWGDGTEVAGQAGPVGTHIYSRVGTYAVSGTVWATTRDGLQNTNVFTTIVVK